MFQTKCERQRKHNETDGVYVWLCATNVIRMVVVLIAQGQTNTHHRRHRRAQSNLDLVLVEEEFKILGIVATNIYVD